VPNLLPTNLDAERLRQKCYLLSEFLDEEDVKLPKLNRQALLHGHCHQKAVLNINAMERVLEKMGMRFEQPEKGCCGMAGSFGFEAEHYDVSMQIGEQNLLPAVRQASPDTVIIADGFSCRTQVREATDRHPLHLAEVLLMAFEEGPDGPHRHLPEQRYVTTQTPMLKTSTVALVSAALVSSIITARVLSRRSR